MYRVPELVSATKMCPQCSAEFKADRRFRPPDGATLRSTSDGGALLGSVVADRCHVVARLGEGGVGRVYLAEHVRMGRRSDLSGAEKAEALYYQAMAKAAQDDRTGACEGFRRAASDASGRLLAAGTVALEVCP